MAVEEDQPDKNTADQPTWASGRGKETLFRVIARNQIELIAIADNKANIIVGINAVIISVIVALTGSGVQIQGARLLENPPIAIPFGILLVFSLVSCIVAILAAKPVMVQSEIDNEPVPSIALFTVAGPQSLQQYLAQMREILSDRDRTYDSLIVEMYANGQVLKRKYKLLNVAYLLLMSGFSSCVLAAVLLQVFSTG